MPFKQEPIRTHVLKPVPFLGVNDTDWPWILLAAGLSYVVSYFLDLKLFRIPLPFILAVSALAVGVLFFNWARTGRKPRWLFYKVLAKVTKAVRRRALGGEHLKRVSRRGWLLDADLRAEQLAELCK